MTTPIPIEITLHKKSKTLEVLFDNHERFIFPCGYLRMSSLSADNKKQVVDKEHVNIVSIEPVGNYAIKPIFSDGHATGIFSWQTLYELGKNLKK